MYKEYNHQCPSAVKNTWKYYFIDCWYKEQFFITKKPERVKYSCNCDLLSDTASKNIIHAIENIESA